MFYYDINECVLTIEINKPLDTHYQMVGHSWSICSMVAPIFFGITVGMYGDIVNSIFCIPLMIFVNSLPRYLCDWLKFITTSLN